MYSNMEESLRNVSLGTSRAALHTSRAANRQRFSLSKPAFPENDITGALTELLKQTWTVFGVSPLFGFQYDELQFKLYAKRLREEIATTLVKEGVAYSAKVSVMESMNPRPSPMDSPAITVEIFGKSTTQEDSPKKCFYKGILISWNTTTRMSIAGNSIRLPLLLCSGTRNCMDIVHATLSRMFDCIIMALPVNENDLMWLVPIVIISSTKDEEPISNGPVTLEYSIPVSPNSDIIKMWFSISDLAQMLAVVIESENDDIGEEITLDIEHVHKFHTHIHGQMFSTSGLQLGSCTLQKIYLPGLTMMGNKVGQKHIVCNQGSLWIYLVQNFVADENLE